MPGQDFARPGLATAPRERRGMGGDFGTQLQQMFALLILAYALAGESLPLGN